MLPNGGSSRANANRQNGEVARRGDDFFEAFTHVQISSGNAFGTKSLQADVEKITIF